MRDTEGVYEISLRAIRPQIVRNTLGTFYLWGCTPDPVPKCRRHIQNNQKYCGINVVNLSESNFRNPSVSGELQASRLPCFPWLKIPRQNLTSKNTINPRAHAQERCSYPRISARKMCPCAVAKKQIQLQTSPHVRTYLQRPNQQIC